MCLWSINKHGEVSNKLDEALVRYWNVKITDLAFVIVERSGKLSEIKLMESLLVSSRSAGNLKLFSFQVHSEYQRETTPNTKLALSSLLRIQNLKENGL